MAVSPFHADPGANATVAPVGARVSTSAPRWAWLVLIVIAVASLWARVELIVSKETYPQHRDEQHITKRAFQILTSGDLNPHFFRYGSLPIYLTSAAMGVGVLQAQATGEIEGHQDVTSVGYPYYSHTSVSWPPRFLFALLSVIGLMLLGVLAYGAFGHPELIVTAPLALITSDLYLRMSWSYVNVDVLATVLSFGVLAHLVCTLHRHDVLHRAIIPALFCGAITATKYNSGVVGVPLMIAILSGPKHLRARHLTWLFACSLAAYAICSPYSFLDWNRFVSDIRYEINHYRTGHAGSDGDPGLPQLQYYWDVLVKDYSPGLTGVGLLGLAYGFLRHRRTTLLLCSFPVVMMLHMATNRVHFPRTVLPALAMYSLFIGLGVTALLRGAHHLGTQANARLRLRSIRSWPLLPAVLQAGTLACLLAAATMTGVIPSALAAHRPRDDSRGLLSQWMRANAPENCLLLFPGQVALDPRPLEGHCDVVFFDLGDTDSDRVIDEAMQAVAWRSVFLAFPRWSSDSRKHNDPALVEQWIAALQRFEHSRPLVTMGRDRVPVQRQAATTGNPQFTVYRVTAWD